MKKALLIITVFYCSLLASRAQFTMAGGGMGYTTGYNFKNHNTGSEKSKSFNIFLKGVYELNGPLQISPSLTFFIPTITETTTTTEESKISLNTIVVDINGHYIIKSGNRFELYGLTGIDILFALRKEVLTITSPLPSTDKFSESDNAIGLNIGAGSYFKLTERLSLFLEARYLLSRYDQFMLNAGFMFML